MTQNVTDNLTFQPKTAVQDTFVAAAPDQYNYANWAANATTAPGLEGSFNFGTVKKMEPIVQGSVATGLAWLVVYSAPESYGASYVGSHYSTTYANAAVTQSNTGDIKASIRSANFYETTNANYGTINDVYVFSTTAPTTGMGAV